MGKTTSSGGGSNVADDELHSQHQQVSESVPFPGARNYGGHLSLQNLSGELHSRIQNDWEQNDGLYHQRSDSEAFSMEPMTRYPYAKKFNTLENAHPHKKFRGNGNVVGDVAANQHNGINGVLLRPLDLEEGGDLPATLTITTTEAAADSNMDVSSTTNNPTPVSSHLHGRFPGVGGGKFIGSGPIKEFSPVMMANGSQVLAVEARNVYKSYSQKRSKIHVLKGLNLTVPQGAIYGLLGPSGCGKTTLLKTIVGMLSVKQGFIKVFGHYPGERESGIPGDRVGYMPQEIALFNEFTIQETMEYFGRIYNMQKSDIQRRMYFLLEFLHLPKPTRFVKNLSGGQKRRVSFAVALLKEPPLLILDEPTVGVDPLLRQSIWEYLVTIANGGNTTIVITTHYIEEARQAHMVGLMRNGRLLAEGAPEDMLIEHGLPTLEDVFLKLCMAERGGAEEGIITTDKAEIALPQIIPPNGSTKGMTGAVSNGTIYPFNTSTEVLVQNGTELGLVASTKPKSKRCCKNCCDFSISGNKIFALFIKSMLKLVRNLGFLGFQFLLPSLQIILFCLAIGRDPEDLPMAVVNHEGSGDGLGFGNLFIDLLGERKLLLRPFPSLPSAVDDVKQGNSWGIVEIPTNFSQDLISRVYQGPAAEDSVIDGSTISVFMDNTNQQIGYSIREKILLSFQEFSIIQMNRSGSNPKLGQIPINFGDPIYGTKDPNFTEFMAPGIILSVSYFMAVGLTALTFVLERKEGQLDRTWVAGVTTVELMISHFLSQFLVMVVQNALSLLFMIVAFNVPCRGPVGWVIVLTLLQGTCGMAYGLLISSFCDEENSAIMFALGSFYPSLLLSGIIWPTEGMPDYLRYISYIVPQTYATESLRALLSRGWGIEYMVVWRGLAVTVGWFFVFFILAGVIFKLRR